MLPLPESPRGRADRLSEPVLYWALKGRVTVAVDGVPHEVDGGQVLSVSRGCMVEVRVRGGDVVVPVPGLALPGGQGPGRAEVPDSWRLWLLRAFGEVLGYLEGPSSRQMLQGILDGASTEGTASALEPPPMPFSEDLGALVSMYREVPAVPLMELARRALPGWSPRTLQRRFLAETGLTPGDWTRRFRMSLAARLLGMGEAVGVVAQTVGYATAGGFARAFRRSAGVTPGAWTTTKRGSPTRLLLPDAPPFTALPARGSWKRVNGAHVAVWVAHGSAAIEVGRSRVTLTAGQAMVLPAGVPNSIRIGPASLLLPVGYRSGADVVSGAGGVVSEALPFADMVRAMVAAYTTVRPAGVAPCDAFERVLTGARRSAPAEAHQVALLGRLASALALGVLDDPTLAGCARWAGVDESLLRTAVKGADGGTFAQWIRMMRMSRARAQLHGGEAASNVSRGLGYAHLPAFTRAFREVHGASPRIIATPHGTWGEAGRWHRAVVSRTGVRPSARR